MGRAAFGFAEAKKTPERVSGGARPLGRLRRPDRDPTAPHGRSRQNHVVDRFPAHRDALAEFIGTGKRTIRRRAGERKAGNDRGQRREVFSSERSISSARLILTGDGASKGLVRD